MAPLQGREPLLEPFDDHVVIREERGANVVGVGSVVLHEDCFPLFVTGDLLL
jgi:hypothetical protein